MRTCVYIDGFNFYFRCVRNTPYKWLNFRTLTEILYSGHQIDSLRYFTALVNPRPGDPQVVQRQEIYLRALSTIKGFHIHYGRFTTHTKQMMLASPKVGQNPLVDVIRTDEKGSDVNLASHLLLDGFRGRYEKAIVISNDSDLAEPVRMVQHDLGLEVSILVPMTGKAHGSIELKNAAGEVKRLRESHLRRSQFQYQLTDGNGNFTKPSTWP